MGKYERMFRKLESSFRPRKDYTHKEVVDDLAYLVSMADSQIEGYQKREDKVNDKFKDLYYGLAISALLNVVLLIAVLK
jgi:hypothetical protein